MGYGRSKLVTEHIVRNAMQTTNMHARVLRIGQLSGDKRSAVWNDTEAVALMIRAALSIKALPALDERPSWLPVDTCAKAVADISMSSQTRGDEDLVYHIVNPRTFCWKADLLPVLKSHPKLPPFEVVSAGEWLRRLEASDHDPTKNPSIKLIDFWRGKYGSNRPSSSVDDEPGGLDFKTSQTVHDIPCLGQGDDPVSEGLISRYVDVWLQKWLAA
jgi:thioester reductase-like protein